MNRSIPVFVAIVIVLGGLSAAAIKVDNTKNAFEKTLSKKIEMDFLEPILTDTDNNYIKVHLGNEETYLMNPGQPMIPRVLKTFELPFGVTNIKIEAETSDIQEFEISKEIEPAPAPLPLTPRSDFVIRSKKDETVYNSNDLYPHAWNGFHVGCGLNGDGEHVTYLTVNIFPLRYRPATGKIIVAKKVDITIHMKIQISKFSH